MIICVHKGEVKRTLAAWTKSGILFEIPAFCGRCIHPYFIGRERRGQLQAPFRAEFLFQPLCLMPPPLGILLSFVQAVLQLFICQSDAVWHHRHASGCLQANFEKNSPRNASKPLRSKTFEKRYRDQQESTHLLTRCPHSFMSPH